MTIPTGNEDQDTAALPQQDYPGAPPPWPGGPPPYTGPPEPPRRKHRLRKVVLLCLAGFVGFIVLIAVVAGLTSGPSVKKAASPQRSASAGPAATTFTDPNGMACASADSAGYCPGDDPVSTPAPADSLTGPLGTTYTDTTQDQSGNDVSYDVTAVKVVDPATGADEFSTPDQGNRFVGVKFRITGDSGYSSDDANSDAVIQGSDGQSYTADFNSLSAGTNFNSGDFGVTKGHTQTGWVTFQVPKGVQVSSVQWQPGLGDQQPATWTVSG